VFSVRGVLEMSKETFFGHEVEWDDVVDFNHKAYLDPTEDRLGWYLVKSAISGDLWSYMGGLYTTNRRPIVQEFAASLPDLEWKLMGLLGELTCQIDKLREEVRDKDD
jgi:hypothetical protein